MYVCLLDSPCQVRLAEGIGIPKQRRWKWMVSLTWYHQGTILSHNGTENI